MGGAVSLSRSNDDMVTKLVDANYIKTPIVEKAFRAVDRGNYVLSKESAYSDNAWRTDKVHVSAPCIYAQALEGLLLESGQSFLNIGSGTGYLSTMVAIILGNEGTNHGIEINSDTIEFAHERLKCFTESSEYDENRFADPVYIHGNAFFMVPPKCKYDRIYCGAAVPLFFFDRLRDDFLNLGGIIVAPVADELLQVYKAGISRDLCCSLLDVSFANLVQKGTRATERNACAPDAKVKLPTRTAQSLLELCRQRVLQLVKRKIMTEKPTRGGIFALSFATENCPPDNPESKSHLDEQFSNATVDHMTQSHALHLSKEEEMKLKEDAVSNFPVLFKKHCKANRSTKCNELLLEFKECLKNNSKYKYYSYRDDCKVRRVCSTKLMFTHSSCRTIEEAKDIEKYPPFRFRLGESLFLPASPLGHRLFADRDSDHRRTPNFRFDLDLCSDHEMAPQSSSDDDDSNDEDEGPSEEHLVALKLTKKKVKAFNKAKEQKPLDLRKNNSNSEADDMGPSTSGLNKLPNDAKTQEDNGSNEASIADCSKAINGSDRESNSGMEEDRGKNIDDNDSNNSKLLKNCDEKSDLEMFDVEDEPLNLTHSPNPNSSSNIKEEEKCANDNSGPCNRWKQTKRSSEDEDGSSSPHCPDMSSSEGDGEKAEKLSCGGRKFFKRRNGEDPKNNTSSASRPPFKFMSFVGGPSQAGASRVSTAHEEDEMEEEEEDNEPEEAAIDEHLETPPEDASPMSQSSRHETLLSLFNRVTNRSLFDPHSVEVLALDALSGLNDVPDDDNDHPDYDHVIDDDDDSSDCDDSASFDSVCSGTKRTFSIASSSDEDPAYYEDVLKASFKNSPETEQKQSSSEGSKPNPENKSKKSKKKKKKSGLWVRGTGGFDSYIEYTCRNSPFNRLPRSFRFDVRVQDRLSTLPLPKRIIESLLLNSWLPHRIPEPQSEDLNFLC